MIFRTNLGCILIILFFTSCITVKKSILRDNKIITLPGPETHAVIGSIKISNLYFDPLTTNSAFNEAASKALSNVAPDALYDLDGDICWITDFKVNAHSLKCLGLCTEISFDILALKQK